MEKYFVRLPEGVTVGLRYDGRPGKQTLMIGGFERDRVYMEKLASDYFGCQVYDGNAREHWIQKNKIQLYFSLQRPAFVKGIKQLQEHFPDGVIATKNLGRVTR